jgi:hypothetical protein
MSTTATFHGVATAYDSDHVMQLLAGGVPLSLLVDLVVPTPSAEILACEGGDAGWMTNVA